MKYIFDFDDTLFYNTKKFKEHMYYCLDKVGIPRSIAEPCYKEVREKEFSLTEFISSLLIRNKKDQTQADFVYEEIMKECQSFLNKELMDKVKEYGKENCFVVSNGSLKFQEEKIRRSSIWSLFEHVYIVPGSKEEPIYKICSDYKDERVIFYEDKERFIKDIDLINCPNLDIVLYKI